jgi:hypothetical protein
MQSQHTDYQTVKNSQLIDYQVDKKFFFNTLIIKQLEGLQDTDYQTVNSGLSRTENKIFCHVLKIKIVNQ